MNSYRHLPSEDAPKQDILISLQELGEKRIPGAVMHKRAAHEIKRLRAIVSHVETWVSNPPGSYSMMALDGLFSQTREMIRSTPTE